MLWLPVLSLHVAGGPLKQVALLRHAHYSQFPLHLSMLNVALQMFDGSDLPSYLWMKKVRLRDGN